MWPGRISTRELDGLVHVLRAEDLARDLAERGPRPAWVVRRRRSDTHLSILVDGEIVLEWWSFWPRPVQVRELRDLGWVEEIGWMARFTPGPGTGLGDEGVVVGPDGEPVVRLFAWRVALSRLVGTDRTPGDRVPHERSR